MIRSLRRTLASAAVPLGLLALAFIGFGIKSPAYWSSGNIVNILVQSSSTAIVAVGMTIVLLTGGIDLSVGAIMFISAAIAGKLVLGDLVPTLPRVPPAAAVLLIVPLGVAFASINAALIAGLRMMPFIVTLATLYIGRGLALQLTETRALNLPDSLLSFGHMRILGIPAPILLLALAVASAHVLMMHTPFGRQVYAYGNNPEAARKAGIRTRRLLVVVYLISGLYAAIGGIVAVTQLGAVSPKFGERYEFAAIAAAVLGGTSLFGGRGNVFPGTLLGAVLIQSVESGLVMVNADPYLYPLVTAGIVFVAVLLDRAAHRGRAA
jgi:ribose transport system permease protein